MKNLKIVYESYIPVDLISDFTHMVQPSKVDKIEKTGSWNNFETVVINDIIIYIKQHPTEIIIGSFVSNAAWEILKSGIKLLWVGISKLPIKILHSGTQTNKVKNILLRFSDETRGIDVVFEGEVNEQQADDIIDRLKETISSEKINDIFYDSDNIPVNSKKPVIRLIYNKNKKNWEPENFGEIRRKNDELKKQFQRKFRS